MTARIRVAILLGALVALVAVPALAGSAEQGRDLLKSKGCLACHSLDGAASVGPTLDGVVERTSPEYVRRAIVDPSADVAEGFVAGTMPKVSLSDGEVDALVAALSEPIPEDELPRTGSMASVAVSAFLFVFLHLLLSGGWVRPRLVDALGEGKFQGLYSLLAAGTFTWVWFAWEAAPYVELWPAAAWARWVPNIGMPFVCILVLAGYTTDSPTIAGKEDALANEQIATGILRVTRHPANVGFSLWGLLHLFPNGDLATVLLIASVVGLGVLGTWHIERRRLARHGDAWRAYTKETSILPFGAILRGGQHLSIREIGWARIGGGLAIWVALLLTHQLLMGASPLPILGS